MIGEARKALAPPVPKYGGRVPYSISRRASVMLEAKETFLLHPVSEQAETQNKEETVRVYF